MHRIWVVAPASREAERNGGRDAYRAVAAQERAKDQCRRPKPNRLARNGVLRERVLDWPDQEWSPEQVELATAEWVDWFNHWRLYQHCGDMPPTEMETAYYTALANR